MFHLDEGRLLHLFKSELKEANDAVVNRRLAITELRNFSSHRVPFWKFQAISIMKASLQDALSVGFDLLIATTKRGQKRDQR